MQGNGVQERCRVCVVCLYWNQARLAGGTGRRKPHNNGYDWLRMTIVQ